jgi:signal transduction histidine kinase
VLQIAATAAHRWGNLKGVPQLHDTGPGFSRLMRPGVALMRALPYGRKFLVVAVCMMVPMLVMAGLLLSALRKEDATIGRELGGVAALAQINRLDTALQRLVLASPGVTPDVLRQQLDKVLDLPRHLLPDEQYPVLGQLAQTRNAARAGQLPGPHAALELMAATHALRQEVYEASGLILDTQLASYYLGDVVAVQLPRVALTQAQLADVLIRDKNVSNVPSNGERLGKMLYDEMRLAEVSEALGFNFSRISGAGVGSLETGHSFPHQQLQRQIRVLTERVAVIRQAGALGDLAQEAQILVLINAMTTTVEQAWDDAQTQLRDALAARGQQVWRLALLVCLGIVLSVGSAWYLFAAFRYGTLADIGQLHRASTALLEQHSNEHFDEQAFMLASRDELSKVSVAFLGFARRLTEDNRRRKAAESAMRVGKQAAEAALVELRETQEKLIRSERLASLGGLVAGVAHEINTPVGIVVLSVSTLELYAAEMQQLLDAGSMHRSDLRKFVAVTKQAAQLIHANAERAATLVRSFKEVSTDQVSEARRGFRVKPYLDDLLASLRPSYKHRPITVALTGDADVEMDSYPGALAQVLSNLVMNSLTHGFVGGVEGRIDIAVLAAAPDAVTIRYQDDGAGIAPEHLGRVFEPFFTTRRGAGGTGLGLSIVHNIVTRVLGGSIRVSSEPGAGTVFHLTLARVAPARTSASAQLGASSGHA